MCPSPNSIVTQRRLCGYCKHRDVPTKAEPCVECFWKDERPNFVMMEREQ